MANRHKKYILSMLAAVLLIAVTGCSSAESDDQSRAAESEKVTLESGDVTEAPTPESENETDRPTSESGNETEAPKVTDEEKPTVEPPDSDGIVTKTEYGEDGSISLVSTNSDGKVVAEINYDVGSNMTVKYAYEYNEQGVLVSEFSYEGEGNLVEEFAAENYENATSWGENHYDLPGDYNVDVEQAFDVTIEELAPLYEKAGEIWDTYGVAVLIADKVSDYTDGAELCYEYKRIEDCLNLIESCLACYPENFFRDFSDDGVTTDVCIQLVGSGSAAGLYMGGYKHLLIQIDVNCYNPDDGYDDNGTFFCYTLHHELFHMISAKLMDRAAQSEYPLTEEKWNSYNPDGFEYVGYYDDEKESELYLSGTNSEYFIYSYSCSTPDEDRAIIFGNAMTYFQGCEDNPIGFNDKIDAKLKYLSDCIRASFYSDNWPEKLPWDYILDA